MYVNDPISVGGKNGKKKFDPSVVGLIGPSVHKINTINKLQYVVPQVGAALLLSC